MKIYEMLIKKGEGRPIRRFIDLDRIVAIDVIEYEVQDRVQRGFDASRLDPLRLSVRYRHRTILVLIIQLCETVMEIDLQEFTAKEDDDGGIKAQIDVLMAAWKA